MQLLQYSGILNNLSVSNKFPFEQVYNYNKEFRTGLRWDPFTPLHIIDNQLWSMCLHGIHTVPSQGNPKQYTLKQHQITRIPAKQGDIKWKHCFDYNLGGCNHPSCSFSHICRVCAGQHPATTCNQCQQYYNSATSFNTLHTQPSANQQPWDTPPTPLHAQPIHLTEQYYMPPTPLQLHRLRELLQLHPNRTKVNYVLDSLTHRFALEYQGHFKFHAPSTLHQQRRTEQ